MEVATGDKDAMCCMVFPDLRSRSIRVNIIFMEERLQFKAGGTHKGAISAPSNQRS